MTETEINVKIIVALIAAAGSLIVAIIGYLGSRKNQRRLEAIKAEYAELKAERDALRDYEYEARKRLYHECGPLLFLLLEHSERALKRIHNIARAAKQGHLGDEDSWFSRRYYRLSTWYILLGPLAILNLIQRRLTLLDLTLDYRIYVQYSIAKMIYQLFAKDFKLVEFAEPEMKYAPHSKEAEGKREDNPEVYRQQGIPLGILDNAVNALILKEEDNNWRVMIFAEFEKEYENKKSELRQAFDRIDYLFEDFHPRTRPVLWLILITQAHLYTVLLQTKVRGEPDQLMKLLEDLPAMDRSAFDWRGKEDKEDKISDGVVLENPFKVTEAFFKKEVKSIIEKSVQMTDVNIK
jgi:hypothetical protein